MRGVVCGHQVGFFGLAIDEHLVPRYEDIVEMNHRDRLGEFGAEFGRCVARPSGRPGYDRDSRRIDRHRAGDRKIAILLAHAAAGQHKEFVHVRPAGDDRLYSGNNDPVRAPFFDMNI